MKKVRAERKGAKISPKYKEGNIGNLKISH